MAALVLHVGLNRTGTTSIQDFMAEAGDALREQGINYLRSGRFHYGRHTTTGQHELAWALRGMHERINSEWTKAADMGVWAAALDEIDLAPGMTHVVSAEDFWLATGEQIRLLGRLLAGHDVTVVLYLRERDAWLKSRYRHRIQWEGATMSFAEFIEGEVTSEPMPGKQVEEWRGTFDRVLVRDFDHLAGKVVLDFCEIIGADPGGLEVDVGLHRNASADGRHLQLLRVLNRLAALPLVGHRMERARTVMRRGPTRTTRLVGTVLPNGEPIL